jgi:uncharacterized protein
MHAITQTKTLETVAQQITKGSTAMSFVITRSGARVDLLTPKPHQIHTADIAHSLANICRFNGHTSNHYSVAQHSLMVSAIVPPEDALAGLLHDATEAYVGDMVRPLKDLLPAFSEIEHGIWLAICGRFGLRPELPESVKAADLVLLATERRDLMASHPEPWPCLVGIRPLPEQIQPWAQHMARDRYHQRLEDLIEAHGLAKELGQ